MEYNSNNWNVYYANYVIVCQILPSIQVLKAILALCQQHYISVSTAESHESSNFRKSPANLLYMNEEVYKSDDHVDIETGAPAITYCGVC